MNLSHLEPSDCPLPNLHIFLAWCHIRDRSNFSQLLPRDGTDLMTLRAEFRAHLELSVMRSVPSRGSGWVNDTY